MNNPDYIHPIDYEWEDMGNNRVAPPNNQRVLAAAVEADTFETVPNQYGASLLFRQGENAVAFYPQGSYLYVLRQDT